MTVAIGPYLQATLEEAPNYEGGTNALSTYSCYPPVEEITDDEAMTDLEEKNVVRGFLAPMPHLGAAKYEPKMKLGKIHPRPSHLGFLLAWMMGSVASVAGDGTKATATDPANNAVPLGAYMHTFTFAFQTEAPTAQLLACTGNGEHRLITGAALSKLDFAFANGALTCDGDGLALVTKPISIGTAPIVDEITPVLDLALPFRQGNMTITWLAESALTRAFTFGFNADVEQIWSPVHSSLFPTDMWYKNDTLPFVSGKIDKAVVSDADWAALAAGTQFAATIEIVHTQDIFTTGGSPTDTGYTYKMWLVMPGCQLTKNSKQAIKAERRRETSYEWESRYDHTTGLLATATVVNATPSYNTWAS